MNILNTLEGYGSREAGVEEVIRRFSGSGLMVQRGRRVVRTWSWLAVVYVVTGLKRFADVVACVLLLAVLWPLMAAMAVWLRATGAVLERTTRMGLWCEPFERWSFASRGGVLGKIVTRPHLKGLPVLFNILRGDMAFVGPRPLSPAEASPRERLVRKRSSVRPGLVSLWWIRKRGSIAYDSETAVDGEYLDTQSLWGDLGIALRAIPAVLYGSDVATAPDMITILDIPINNMTMSEAVERIVARLTAGLRGQVCFVNADCANIACRDDEYLAVLQRSDLTFADGIGVRLAGRLLGLQVKQNVNGTDLFPILCGALALTGRKVFLLGAKPGVAEGVRDWINRNHPGLGVAGCHHGYFSPREEGAVIRKIADSGADLLLVAFGAPRQDKWISRHLGQTGAKMGIGVGGLFDFYSGSTPRAPMWMREMGLEWLYRFCREPGRLWERNLVGNTQFLRRVLRERRRRPHGMRASINLS